MEKTLRREILVRRGPLTVTKDVSKALDKLETLAKEFDWNLKLTQRTETERKLPRFLSMQPSGREVLIEAIPKNLHGDFDPNHDRLNRIIVIWSMAIPLGFTPMSRYPLVGENDTVFHFFGPWHGVMDRMSAEGRGEQGWPSVCCAAQVDVGRWQDGRNLERFVQTQLHRIGSNPGPVDGLIGDRTVDVFLSLGIKGKTLDQIADYLRDLETPAPKKRELTLGHIIIPGRNFTVLPHGPIGVVRNRDRVSMSIAGPGRVILDIGEID